MPRRLPLAVALFTALLWCAAPAFAQEAPGGVAVHGIVVDARTGTPLAGVRVLIARLCDVRTDAGGAFACPDVPEGPHRLRASMLGYVQPDVEIVVSPASALDLRIELAETPAPLHETVTVTGDRFATRDAATPGEMVIGSADLFALRGVLTDDPMRAVQAMPGVASTDDFTADISIRGMSPDRTALLVDGTRARTAVHALQGRDDTGSVSLINSDLLERVTLSPGSRPLRSGDRTSGQVDFTTREGSRRGVRVQGIAGAAIASVVAEGPLGRRDGTAAWMVAGRVSYVGWIARRIEPDTTTTFVFGDVNAKVSWDHTPRHRVDVLALAGRLAIDERDDAPGRNSLDGATTDSGFALVSSRLQVSPSVSMRHRLAIGADRFLNENSLGETLGEGRRFDVALYHDTTWIATPQLVVDGGLVAERARDALTLRRLATRAPLVTVLDDAHGVRYTLGGHAGATWTPRPRLTVTSGVRLDRDDLVGGGPVASPWLLAEWQLAPHWTMRGGVTAMHQAPTLNQLQGLRGQASLPFERATSGDLLFARRLSDAWRLQASAYRRVSDDEARLPAGEPVLVNGRVRPASTTSRWDARLESTGEGIEVLAQRAAPSGVSGWLAYSYGRMRMHDRVTGERYAGDFDQRHGLNAYVGWRWTYRTAAAAKFRYGSNVPLQGYYAPTTPDADGTPQFIAASSRNTSRLPTYARLDVRVHRAFVRATRRFTVFAEVLNVLNRRNWGPSGVRSAERLFPILPTAGLLVEW